jgi:tetratricopeptide (TPR) repeat protein
VTQKIAAALGGHWGTLVEADAASARRKPANLQAYDYYVLGNELLPRVAAEDRAQAEKLFKKSIELDPQFARAYASLARIYMSQAWHGWGSESRAVLFEKAQATALKSIALDPTDAKAHMQLGEAYFNVGDFDHGLVAFEQAYSLNPNDPMTLVVYGNELAYVGRAQQGVEMINRAFRLNPYSPGYYNGYSAPFYATGQYDQVITKLRRTNCCNVWNRMLLAISYAQLGQQPETAAAVAELLHQYPDYSFERQLSEFGGIRDQSTLAHFLDGVRKAGLRECASEAELQKYPKMKHLAVCDAKRATN